MCVILGRSWSIRRSVSPRVIFKTFGLYFKAGRSQRDVYSVKVQAANRRFLVCLWAPKKRTFSLYHPRKAIILIVSLQLKSNCRILYNKVMSWSVFFFVIKYLIPPQLSAAGTSRWAFWSSAFLNALGSALRHRFSYKLERTAFLPTSERNVTFSFNSVLEN